MKTKNVFRDGATKPGFVKAVEGLHDALLWEQRPMLPEEVELLENAAQRRANPQEGIRLIQAALAQKLVSWSEVDDAGNPMAINFRNMANLPYSLLYKLYKRVAGLEPTDPLPEPTEGEDAGYVAGLMASVASGIAPGVNEDKAAVKN